MHSPGISVPAVAAKLTGVTGVVDSPPMSRGTLVAKVHVSDMTAVLLSGKSFSCSGRTSDGIISKLVEEQDLGSCLPTSLMTFRTIYGYGTKEIRESVRYL